MMKTFPLFLLIMACTPSEEKQMLLASAETYDQAVIIGKHIENEIARIETHTKNIEEPLKSIMLDSVEALYDGLEYWKSIIIEVPDHQLGHDSHQGHNHERVQGLTPEMILAIQNEMKNEAIKLNARTQKVIDIIENN